MDNTWGTPYLFRSFEHGVDVSIHAATKYICGHSDVMLGAVITNEEIFLPVRSAMAQIGHCAGPDDVFFALRGMRTLERAAGAASEKCDGGRALAADPAAKSRACSTRRCRKIPGHAIWKRDFLGASGLFAVVLKPAPKERSTR